MSLGGFGPDEVKLCTYACGAIDAGFDHHLRDCPYTLARRQRVRSFEVLAGVLLAIFAAFAAGTLLIQVAELPIWYGS